MKEDKPDLSSEVADARARFDEACARLRPDLHRFCAKMTGSACDGEDVLQEVLVHAFYRLPELRDAASLRSWLFRIAHNKCIDHLRARRPLVAFREEEEAMAEAPSPNDLGEEIEHKERAENALAAIVTELPPKERACVVLKDVLDCSLEETAEITGSNVGAVKAALHRGREKLARADDAPPREARVMSREDRALVARYVACFNRRDWDGVRALLAEGARLDVVGRVEGPFGDTYFTNYARLAHEWRLGLARVDGAEALVHYKKNGEAWVPHAIVRVDVAGGRVTRVRDYVHVDYLLRHARVDDVDESDDVLPSPE